MLELMWNCFSQLVIIMNLNKRDFFINLVLFLLIILLLIQAGFLWISFSMPNKVEDLVFKSEDASMDVFMPSMLVVNLGYREHYVLRNFKDYWKLYSSDISEILENASSENLIMIDEKTYLNLQNKKSLVFKFSSPISASILINLIGENKKDSNINLSINSIYISDDNDVYLCASNNFYKLLGLKTNLKMNRLIDNAKNLGTRYINFFERYGIYKDTLIPDSDFIKTQKIYYNIATDALTDDIRNNLAVRYLQTDLDYIKEIKQSEKTSYVYENKYISFNKNGIVEYSNEEEFNVTDRNLYTSIITALEFLSRNSGMTSNVYLDSTNPIEYKGSLGYKFFFNLRESGKNLVLNSKDNSFIEMDVFSNHVKFYREYYFKRADDPSYNELRVKVLDIKTIIDRNLKIFPQEKTEDILNLLNNLSIVYINESTTDSSKLKLAYELLINGKKYYFDISLGKLILIR